jgi:hypothetical protein
MFIKRLHLLLFALFFFTDEFRHMRFPSVLVTHIEEAYKRNKKDHRCE